MGWRRSAVGYYDEDGSAETGDGTPVLGRRWYVIRGGYVYSDAYERHHDAREARREFHEQEAQWWALDESERAQREDRFACFMRRVFDPTRPPLEYPEF